MSLDLSDETPYYSLGRLDGEIGFYKFTGGSITLGANKAYLDTTTPSGNVKGFRFDLETGIEGIEDVDLVVSVVCLPEEAFLGQLLEKFRYRYGVDDGFHVHDERFSGQGI